MAAKNYVNEVTLENEAHRELVNEINTLETRIAARNESIELMARFKESAQNFDATARAERAKFSVDNIYTLEGLDYSFRLNTNITELVDEYITNYTGRRDNMLKNLAEKKERLSETQNNSAVVKLSEIQEKLSRISFLKPRSVKLYTTERAYTGSQEPWLAFNTAPVLCTIDREIQIRYDWLSTPHTYPSIKLGGTKVSVNLRTGRLTIVPALTKNLIEKQRFVTSYNNAAAHPHCLTDHEPCMGDFAGPFREAISDRDWVYAASIVGLFLSGAAWEDSAGYYFHAAYGNILARIEGKTSKCLGIEPDGFYYVDDVRKRVSFEELAVPGDYIVRIDGQEYKYLPSSNYMEQVEST